jgi:2-oxoisovalerate dehydrogenase E1 component
VLIMEHADLYEQKGEVPVQGLDYYVAYGKARVVRPGEDVTVLTYLSGVSDALAAAGELEQAGIDAEIIDLRTLDYTGMDYAAIGESIRKTGRVIIVEQIPRSMGLSARLSDEIQERFYDDLDGPVEKIAAPDVPPPVSRALERAMIPDVRLIKERIANVGKA